VENCVFPKYSDGTASEAEIHGSVSDFAVFLAQEQVTLRLRKCKASKKRTSCWAVGGRASRTQTQARGPAPNVMGDGLPQSVCGNRLQTAAVLLPKGVVVNDCGKDGQYPPISRSFLLQAPARFPDRESREIQLALYLKGLKTDTGKCAKSVSLRVATVRPCTRAEAAIRASSLKVFDTC
jgi:hypothetical protein